MANLFFFISKGMMLAKERKFLTFTEFKKKYSRLPIIRTFKGNRKKVELSGVPVIEGKIIWKMKMKGNENYF